MSELFFECKGKSRTIRIPIHLQTIAIGKKFDGGDPHSVTLDFLVLSNDEFDEWSELVKML